MTKIGLFAGTTEGRMFLDRVKNRELSITVFVATQFGEDCLSAFEDADIRIEAGRLDEQKMTEIFREEKFDFIVDATHPHAEVVTENIKRACDSEKIRYIRIVRKEQETKNDCVTYFKDIEEIAAYLKMHSGKALLATGSKELAPYKEVPGYEERFYLRVLSSAEAVLKATEAGFKGKHLIAMQGPFSEEMNYLLLKETGATYFVTKDSGASGGFPEKLSAASRAGVRVLAVSRKTETGLTYNEAADLVGGAETKVSLIGIGPGNIKDMTLRAWKAVGEADLLIGAGRMLEAFRHLNKEMYNMYCPDDIMAVIRKAEGRRIAVLYSGDTGFHSGAAGLLRCLHEEERYDTEVICGLSSLSVFASKIGKSYDKAGLLSLHGEKASIGEVLMEKGSVFVLMDYKKRIEETLRELEELGLGETFYAAGSRLSYDDECIVKGRVRDGIKLPEKFSDLSVLYLEKEKEKEKRMVTSGLKDEMFLRGRIPMTKREVRSVVLSLLELGEDSVLYDIGAGTGSVSCEAARLLKKGSVLAVERTQEGAALIEKNRQNMHLSNLYVYCGTAPEILRNMEEKDRPTHAFIGGSGGTLIEILDRLFTLNAEIRVVLTAITPETLGKAAGYAEMHNLKTDITLLQSSRSRKAGKGHLMMGMNPVWIMTMEGENTDEI